MYILKLFCALAVAFLCADGAKGYFTTVQQLNDTTKDLDQLLFKVTCGGTCAIRDIEFDGITSKKNGELNGILWAYYVTAEHPTLDVCTISQKNQKCQPLPKTLQETKFFIKLNPWPEFTGGKITLTMDNRKATMTEINYEGASVWSGQGYCGSNTTCVRLKSGLGTTVFPARKKQYEVRCNGNCKNLEFVAESDQDVMLALAEGHPVLPKKGGCYNCVCTSTGGHSKVCKNSAGKSKFSLNSDNVYITLVPDNKLTDVVAYLRGDNIKSVDGDYDGINYVPHFVYNDGKRGLIRLIKGPITYNKTAMTMVFCKGNKKCKNVKIEIFSAAPVYSVVAGNDKVNSCNGVKSCATRFNPTLKRFTVPWGHYYVFYVRVKLGKSNTHFSTYVTLSGDNLNFAIHHRPLPARGPPTRGPPTKGPPTRGPPTRGPPTRRPPTGGRPTGGTPTRGTPTRGTPTRGTPTRGTPSRG